MTPDDVSAFLSLGASKGAREVAILRAIRAISASGAARVLAVSSLYETAPVGVAFPDFFINAAVQVRPLLSPRDLLNRLKTIEKELGRTGGHNAPREIDVDMIAYGNVSLDTAELCLPHPRYRERAFVLVPLREIAPWFRCPASGRRVEELIASLPTPGDVTRITRRATIARKAP